MVRLFFLREQLYLRLQSQPLVLREPWFICATVNIVLLAII